MKYKYLPRRYGNVLGGEEMCLLKYSKYDSDKEVLAVIYGLNTFPEILEKDYDFYDRINCVSTPPNTMVIVRKPA